MFAMGMGTSTYQQGLEEALERAIDSYREQTGFTGTPRLLLGTHSQAGIVGTNLVADAAFRQKYHIDGVVTFGAPFKSSNDLGGVPLMSIENDSRYGILLLGGDPVPKLDLGGIGNPGGEYGVNDVTKIFTPPVTNSWNPFEAHKQANYEMAVDRMLSPSATGGWATSGQTVREGLAEIPSVESSDVAWKRAGFDQTVTIRLTADADDAGSARQIAESALDVVAEAARDARGNGRIELKVYYSQGSQVLDAYREGLPSRFDQLEDR